MEYYHAREFAGLSYEEVLALVPEALKKEGFGVLTEIDVARVMKEKLDKDLRPYKILGACNPNFAYQALSLENKIGTMLPCNVVVQELENGNTEVAVVDPMGSMQAVENEGLAEVAAEVQERLKRVLDHI
ncbi:DUF302 domain-containing protein [Fulvivirga sedimenti]|uniref:DUF302 domain-containing protein n=1 Tax=Fulvivirga sedimenti TaxID=2879465 RepID=A0A9X1KXM8_9BACT|nr:DUF302 domain-containing protein [Fulvivirga sedimenti]MCA6074908.1 DUF302 domain-containing protein [Fulvivirga sedimenti]MCA6076085.1 DUF302 domain-containing protein [Fulvivirga sedimenti]MCA6077213.1 DUF302 domain-containing protein [Fulvivirga sedimenti]